MQNIESPDTPIRGYFSISESYREKLRAEASSAKERNGESNQSLEREKMLLKRLMETEDVYEDVSRQLQELKKSMQLPATFKNKIVDPSVCVFIQTLQSELKLAKQKYEKTKEDLDAWTLTPDSYIEKRLMAECHRLKRENEELGVMVSSGQVAKLEMELAMEKAATEEEKKSDTELEVRLKSMQEDSLAFQTMVFHLQSIQNKYKENKERLMAQNDELNEVLHSLKTREKCFKTMEKNYRSLKRDLRRPLELDREMRRLRNANDSNKPDGEKSGHLSDEDSESGSGEEEESDEDSGDKEMDAGKT